MKHNYTGYTHGCRCKTCRAAGRAYRASRRGQPVPGYVGHGTLGAYQHWRCRCEMCVEARRSYDRDRYAASKRKATA